MVVTNLMLELDLDVRNFDIFFGCIFRGDLQDQTLLMIIDGIPADVSNKLAESKRG